jgi:hypothetical protein
MLLINPPVMKPCEPPAGIARLKGFLDRHNVQCRLLDANLEALLILPRSHKHGADRWTQRAVRHFPNNLASLRNLKTYHNLDGYKRAVLDLNRLLEMASANSARVSLSNYQHPTLSPLSSADLLRQAENPEENPFYPYFSERLSEVIETENVSLVGFSLTFLSQALCTFAMIGFLRRRFPLLTLVVGGGLMTSWMRKPGWKDPFAGLIDHLVDGPGENQLLSLLGKNEERREVCRPSYTELPVCQYLSPGMILPYSASSGCYWNRCRFCPERAEQNCYEPISAPRAAEDVSTLAAEFQPILIHLLDNAVTPALMKALCANPPNAPWYGFARITRHLRDEDFCRALKRSGCVMLKLGLESGDQKVLDQEQKGVDLEMASKVLKSLKRAGIASYVYLLFGTPSETLDSARKTLNFTVLHGEQIDFLNLAIFNLPIYSPDARKLTTEAFDESDLSLYTGFVHPRGWHRGLVRQFLDKEFKRHPVVAAIVRKDPPFFTSNHAPLFCL